MKTMKKVMSVLLLACMLTAMCGAGAYAEGLTYNSANPTTLVVGESYNLIIDIELPEGATLDTGEGSLNVYAEKKANKEADIFSTTNKSVSTDNNKISCTVTGNNPGEDTLIYNVKYTTAAANNGTETKRLNGSQVIKVVARSLTLDKTALDMYVGDSAVKLTPTSNFTGNITWESSNTDVATVNESGEVTAVKAGATTITAKNGDTQATCAVTVKQHATGITLDKTTVSIYVGNDEQLTATVSPNDATNSNVTWTSSDASVATVDSTGKVHGVAAGTATITATALDGSGVTASCTVTVVTVPVDSVTITDGESIDLDYNATKTLTATVSPDDATDRTVTWSSSNSEIVSVDTTGLIKGLKPGTAVITATSGGKTDTITVNVKGSITISGTNKMTSGQSVQLSAALSPDSTDKTVGWTSSDTSVATVDTNGNVTGVKAGTATITASKDGYKDATFDIEVVSANQKYVVITPASAKITTRGGSTQFTATVMQNNAATGDTVTNIYISSSSVTSGTGAYLTRSGNTATFTANYNGVYTVKAEYKDGSSTATSEAMVTVSYQPVVISGNYTTYNGKDGMAFVVNDSFSNFSGKIWVDNREVSNNGTYYGATATPDGMIGIWLSPNLLNLLGTGTATHTLTIGDNYGNAVAYFRTYTTTTAINGVKTGDDANPTLWATLAAISAIGAAAAVTVVKRRREK